MFCLFDLIFDMEGITTGCIQPYSQSGNHLAMGKCRGSHFQFCTNAAIYPRFLIWVGFNSHRGNSIRYTLPDERVRVHVDVVQPGTYPSPRDQNSLEVWNPIVPTSVE